MSPPGESESVSDAAVDRRSNTASALALSPASASSDENEWSREPTQDSPAVASGSQYESPRPASRKRRRITRACDDCRRKKIKCDGKQPCTSCADFNSECTYDRPSARMGRANARHLQMMEKRLHRAETLLRQFLPSVDLESLEPPAALRRKSPAAPAPADVGRHAENPGPSRGASAAAESMLDAARYIPLVERIGQLDLTDSGEYVFHGLSSGPAFLSRMTQQFPALFSYDSRTPFLPQPHRPFLASPMGGLPVYSADPWWQANYDHSKLPPRNLAHALCEYCFSRASCILRIVHTPSFWKMFDRLYAERPQRFSHEERRFVGLVFSVIALGSMYDVDENDPTNPDHYAVAMDRGYKYYISARLYLQDISECGDMTTLQALVFIIQFLQATGNLSGCHTFIGIALRSSLRMGLHRHLLHTPMSPIQDETRRRVFHTIRQMDIYLSTTLGLPLLLQEKDIDQPWPTEVEDEYITEDAISRAPPGTTSFLEAFNAHTRLMRILAKVVEHLYPPKGTNRGPTDVTYMISCARIREIEKDLHEWHEQLPSIWRPGPEEENNTQITRAKILLRFAYGHVQMMLYRPFLQFHSRQSSVDGDLDERYLAFANAGINVCRNIIQIGLEIQRQAVLIGPYWFITYTQFFAILSVVLYVLHNPDKPGAAELFSDAKMGKDCISGMTQRSLAADRVSAALNSLFDQLPGDLASTDPSAREPSSGPAAKVGQPPLRSGLASVARHSDPSSIYGSRQHWGLHASTQSETSRPRDRVPSRRREPAMQPVPISAPIQGNGPVDMMGFPMEDPFAYPQMPGVSLAGAGFATLSEDTMRLPVYNMHTDMSGQLMYLQDLSQSTPPASMPAETNGFRSISQAIFRSLNSPEDGLLWEQPETYGLSPF